jgi:RNA polymerase sigma-70 factor, ECF subfamily
MLQRMATADLDDAALMARIATGDRDAFRGLVARLHGPALGLATRVLGDRGDAEDAVQAALVKLWTQAGRYDAARGTASSWFRRIVTNLCLDRRRSMRVVASLEDAADVASLSPTPFETASANADAARVQAAVGRLNPRQRAAIALFYGDGATMAEIADVLETTPKAVEGLLARARIELQQTLAPAGEER